MLRKDVKSLLEQLQICIFAKIVFGVRCTLSRSVKTAMLCRERSLICRSSIFNLLLLPDCFSSNAKEKSGTPVEENNNNISIGNHTVSSSI